VMVCGVPIPAEELMFGLIILVTSVISTISACFLILGIFDAWNDEETQSEDSTKKTIRYLLCMLSVSDLCWSFSTALYVFLQMYTDLGNMGYCSFFYCIANRAWHHFFSFMNIATTFCISLYIFIGFFFPHLIKGPNYQSMSLLFVFATVFISLIDVLAFLMFTKIKVVSSGWCEPTDELWFYFEIPVIVVFVCILLINVMCIVSFLSLSEKLNVNLSFASRRLFGYVVAFFIIWLPTVIWVAMDIKGNKPDRWVSIVRIIGNCSNGTIDLIVYGLVNESFRKRYNTFCGQPLLYWLISPFLLLISLFRFFCGCSCNFSSELREKDYGDGMHTQNDYLDPSKQGDTHMVNYSEDQSSRSVTDYEYQ
jgi:hypothetical protein